MRSCLENRERFIKILITCVKVQSHALVQLRDAIASMLEELSKFLTDKLIMAKIKITQD